MTFPFGDILGLVLVVVAVIVIGRAAYRVLGSGSADAESKDQQLREMESRLLETEERLDAAEQALRRQKERDRLPPGA